MPHLNIYNLCPFDRTPEHLKEIKKAINVAITGILELKLTDADISYSFPQDDSAQSEDTIVVIVELLFDKSERTFEIRTLMAKLIGEVLHDRIKQWRTCMPSRMEVAVKRFDPNEDGFWSAQKIA